MKVNVSHKCIWSEYITALSIFSVFHFVVGLLDLDSFSLVFFILSHSLIQINAHRVYVIQWQNMLLMVPFLLLLFGHTHSVCQSANLPQSHMRTKKAPPRNLLTDAYTFSLLIFCFLLLLIWLFITLTNTTQHTIAVHRRVHIHVRLLQTNCFLCNGVFGFHHLSTRFMCNSIWCVIWTILSWQLWVAKQHKWMRESEGAGSEEIKKNEQREKSIAIRKRGTIPRNPRDSHAENVKACTYANKKNGKEMKS